MQPGRVQGQRHAAQVISLKETDVAITASVSVAAAEVLWHSTALETVTLWSKAGGQLRTNRTHSHLGPNL
jgi:hypothetical protein